MDAPTAIPIVAPVDNEPSFLPGSASSVFVGVAVGSVEEVGLAVGVDVGLDDDEVVVSSCPFAAAKKSLWLTLMRVLESVQAPDMVV